MLRDLLPSKGPGRRLVVLTVVQSAGNGLFLTSSAVFFVRVVGLGAGQVGLGLSLAGLAGFLTTVPVGRLADRYGARRLLALDYAALAVLFALYPFVRGFTAFAVIASLISIAEISGSPLRSAVTHALFAPEEAVRARAQMRSGFNVGFMLGAAVAGVALAHVTRSTFATVSVANAVAQGLCAVVAMRLGAPNGSPREARARGRAGSALRDTRFVLLTLGNGLLELHATVLTVGMPLWLVRHTAAPASLNSVLIILNTLIVVLLQVRLSRGADSVKGSARLQRRASAILAAGCVVCAMSRGNSPASSMLWAACGAAIIAVGELRQSAAAWGLSFELPPPGRQGEYQAVFGLGRGIQQFLGPALVTALLVGVGALGWLMLAALFLVVGLLCFRVVMGSWHSAAHRRSGRHPGRHRRDPRTPPRGVASAVRDRPTPAWAHLRTVPLPTTTRPSRWPGPSDTAGSARAADGSPESGWTAATRNLRFERPGRTPPGIWLPAQPGRRPAGAARP